MFKQTYSFVKCISDLYGSGENRLSRKKKFEKGQNAQEHGNLYCI